LNSGAAVSATAFDDVRIYPKDALMTTYTYDPLVGVTSTTDPKGQSVYYEYDPFLRLMNVKDKDGNIIKHTDYHYQGQ
jgi:YD repeat-containing protein